MIKYDFHVTQQDYIDFNMYTVKHNPALKRTTLLLRLTLPFMLALLYLLVGIKEPETRLSNGIFYLILSVIWFFTIKPLYNAIMKRTVKRQLKQSSHLYTPEGTLTFDDDDFTEITPQQETKYAYERIEGIAQNGGSVYIYLSSLTAILIPSSVFVNEDDRAKLLNMLRQKRPEITVEK